MKIVVCEICSDLIANWDRTIKTCRCKATKCKYDNDGRTLLISAPIMPFVFAVGNSGLKEHHDKWERDNTHKADLKSWSLPSNHEQLKRVKSID